ncbi:hypothetical protein [Nocardioides luteus]|uniref:hypothetical protein n=1 Tax=Nocardioides luteus TaxID=1844 RepID=UPI000AEF5FF7|nr:hypothetical protein [Nocardioides luteus]
MEDALRTMLPLLAFMFIPIWIPMIAAVVGAVADRLGALRGADRGAFSAEAFRAERARDRA